MCLKKEKKIAYVKNVKLVYKSMNQLHQQFVKTIRPKLQKEMNLKSVMAVPTLEKVVCNVGVGKGLKDDKYVEAVISTLSRITGQKPIRTKAKKSIAAFKIREGNTVGLKVTLRGERMWDFIAKLIHASLPRVRDFQGLKINSFDGKGNYTIGIKEHIIFPEIKADEVENLHGLEIIVVTTAQTDEAARQLLIALEFPFSKK